MEPKGEESSEISNKRSVASVRFSVDMVSAHWSNRWSNLSPLISKASVSDKSLLDLSSSVAGVVPVCE